MKHDDDQFMDRAGRDPYGALGLDEDPDVAFAGSRALRLLAEFCERYQVSRLRQAGHTWAEIGGWAGVSAQAHWSCDGSSLVKGGHTSVRPSERTPSLWSRPGRACDSVRLPSMSLRLRSR